MGQMDGASAGLLGSRNPTKVSGSEKEAARLRVYSFSLVLLQCLLLALYRIVFPVLIL